MINIRQLTQQDKSQLDMLISTIEQKLNNKQWWLPIKKTAREHFFDEGWTIFYGAFDRECLVAACALFLNPYEYEQSANVLHLNLSDVAEIGRCMVHPDYRHQNLMYVINQELLKEAEKRGKNKIIATAHPTNISSNKSLQRLGMNVKALITKEGGYERNIYLLEL